MHQFLFDGHYVRRQPVTISWGMVTIRGDINMNGVVEFSDIPPFIQLLISGENQAEADCDCNEEVNFADIRYFISIPIESLALAKTVLRINKQVEPSSVHLLVRDREGFLLVSVRGSTGCSRSSGRVLGDIPAVVWVNGQPLGQ